MKKLKILTAFIAMFLTLCSFSIDCEAQFSIAFSNAVTNYEVNSNYCSDEFIIIRNRCCREADMQFDQAVHDALDEYENCAY
jgi:hypothetical protein